MIGMVPLRRWGVVIAFAMVDAVDIEYVGQLPWHLDGSGYPASSFRERLHRFLVEVPPGYVVDHINRNKLDNRLSNLRVTTQQVNMQNTSGSPTRVSDFRGVYFDRRHGNWYGQVKHEGRKYSTKRFRSQEEAAEAVALLRESVFRPPLVLPTIRRTHELRPPRDLTRCVNGHPWSEHTYINPQGRRSCRECSRAAGRRYWQRRYHLGDAA